MRIRGKQIAAARELLGITQEELAAAAGIGRQTIARFEAGLADPRPESINKIRVELERRGIEFSNGGGMGVRLNFAKAEKDSQAGDGPDL